MTRHITSIPHFIVKHKYFSSFAPVNFNKLEHFVRHFQNVIFTGKMLGSNSTFHYYGSKSLNLMARLKLELGHLRFHKSFQVHQTLSDLMLS